MDAAGNLSGRTITLRGLPELAGKLQADASAALTARGFKPGDVTNEPSPEPVGTVLAPADEAVAAAGSAVDLVVSSGPGTGDGGGATSLRLHVAQSKTYAWRTERAIGARVSLSSGAGVSALLQGPGGNPLKTWSFAARAGATVVRMVMPAAVKRSGSYRIVWTARAGGATATETHKLRVVAWRVRARVGLVKVDVLVAGPQSLRKKLVGRLPVSARLSLAGVDGAFDLTANQARDVRVVVVDLDQHGVGLVRDLRTVFADVRLVGVGGDGRMRVEAIQAGAAAALPRSATAKQLARTVVRLLASG